MEENKIESGNKKIMQFMGWEETDSEVYRGYMNPPQELRSFTQPFHPESAKYHSNWQWQIPVYSKLAKEMKEIAKCSDLIKNYGEATLNDDKLKGFEIIIENLNWLNKIK